MSGLQKIVIICGPTAVGKTAVSIDLAKKFNGEIVSADSQQIWKGFDVGTAKADLTSRSDVTHHLIDVAEPEERFDAKRFVEMADEAISDISSRGRLPIVVGGTGMYLRMLLHGLCEAPPQDADYRRKLETEIERDGLAVLHSRLAEVDPESARNIHPNDTTRIVRALEIHHLTDVAASEFRESHGFNESRYDAVKIGLNIDREELYRRIDERVDRMMQEGLIDEVKDLLARHDVSCQPFQAVGYREIVDFLEGSIDLERAVYLTKRNSRHFAKRQLTWFRSDKEIQWFDPAELSGLERTIAEFLRID